jgi:inhibitor of cysteine peptidase
VRTTVVLAVLALVAAVSAGPASAKTVRVTARANGTRVTVHRGDRIEIKLASNPSTGYRWRTVSSGRPVVKLTASTYQGRERFPGAAGTQTFTFRALGQGSAELRLVYTQAGSNDVGKRFRLTVVVR